MLENRDSLVPLYYHHRDLSYIFSGTSAVQSLHRLKAFFQKLTKFRKSSLRLNTDSKGNREDYFGKEASATADYKFTVLVSRGLFARLFLCLNLPTRRYSVPLNCRRPLQFRDISGRWINMSMCWILKVILYPQQIPNTLGNPSKAELYSPVCLYSSCSLLSCFRRACTLQARGAHLTPPSLQMSPHTKMWIGCQNRCDNMLSRSHHKSNIYLRPAQDSSQRSGKRLIWHSWSSELCRSLHFLA